MKKKFNYLLIMAVIVIFAQCSKEDNVLMEKVYNSKEVTIKNGRIVFNNEETLNNTIDKLLNMDDEKLISWYKQNNFESIWLIYHKAYNEMEELTTADDIYNFANKYKNYFEIITDENGEENLIEKIDNPLYVRIINKNGEYVCNGKINKIIEDKIVSINKEDYSVIQNLNPTDIIEIAKNDERINLFYLSDKNNNYILKSGNYGSSQEATYTRDERRCKHDRKVILNIRTEVVYNSYRRVYIVAKVYGKRKFGCIWSRYTTGLNLRNVSFSVRYKVSVPGGGISYNYYSGTISNADINSNELVVYDYKDDIYVSPDKHTYFTRVYGKASSTGVGNNWALINCQ